MQTKNETSKETESKWLLQINDNYPYIIHFKFRPRQ